MEKHIKNCVRCINSKRYKEILPEQPMLDAHPMQFVHIDYLTVELAKKHRGSFEKDISVLVITDHFKGMHKHLLPNSSQQT